MSKNETKHSNGRARNTTKHRKYSKNMCNNGSKTTFSTSIRISNRRKNTKRAGLDYWDKLDIEEHDSLEKFLEKYKPEENNMFFATTKGKTQYTDIDYSKMDEVFVLYGKETKGLPEWLLEKYLDKKTIRIPMLPTLRSLNLSNSVAIITYEILRQHNFEDLQGTSNYFDK